MKKLTALMLSLFAAATWNALSAQDYLQGESLVLDKSQVTSTMGFQGGGTGTQDPDRWFDDDFTTISETTTDNMPSADAKKELIFDLGKAVKGIYFAYVPRDIWSASVNDAPKDFTVYGSTDNENWTEITTITNFGGTTKETWYTTDAIPFSSDFTAEYQYVKFHFTKAWSSDGGTRFGKFEGVTYNGQNDTHPVPYITFAEMRIYEALENKWVDITWNVTNGGKVIYSYVQKTEIGTRVSNIPKELLREFVTYGTPSERFVAQKNEPKTVEVEATWSLGQEATSGFSLVELSETLEDAKWYHICANNSQSNKYYLNNTKEVARKALDTTDPSFFWAFVGNPVAGVKIYNLSTWPEPIEYVLAHNNSKAKLVAVDDESYANKLWIPRYAEQDGKAATDGRLIFVAGNYCINGNSLPGLQWHTPLFATGSTEPQTGRTSGWGNQQMRFIEADASIVADFKANLVAQTEFPAHWVIKDPAGNILLEKDIIHNEAHIDAVPESSDQIDVPFAKYPDFTGVDLTANVVTTVTVTAQWDESVIKVADKVENATWYRIRTQDSSGESMGFDADNNVFKGVMGNGSSFIAEDLGFYWAVVSDNPFQGVKVYNLAAYIKNQNAVLASDGKNNWITVDETDYDADTYNTTFHIYFHGLSTGGRFNFVDYKYMSPCIKNWPGGQSWWNLSTQLWGDWVNGWGQFCRLAAPADDKYQDPSQLIETDMTAEYNANLAPWLVPANAGKYFQLKQSVMDEITASYDLEALATSCGSTAYAQLKGKVTDWNNLVWPAANSYVRIKGNHPTEATHEYITIKNGSTFTTVAEDEAANDPGTVFFINVRNGGPSAVKYHWWISAQGDHFLYPYNNPKTEAKWEGIAIYPVAPGKAAIYDRWAYDFQNSYKFTQPEEAINFFHTSTTNFLACVGGTLGYCNSTNTTNNNMEWEFEDATEATLNVALNAAGAASYATFCASFPYQLNGETKAYAAVVAEKDGSTVADLVEVADGKVAAGVPVLLVNANAEAAAELVPTAKGTGNTPEANNLVGNYLPEAWDAANLALGQSAGVVGFYKWNGTELKANHAYIPATSVPAGTRQVLINLGGTTGIGTTLSETSVEAQGLYDLQGRRVNAAQNGVFIVNGKKVLVK